jgi:hypothetical protein
MSDHEQHEHDEPQRPRRETIMQRRLRARGEHVEPPPDEPERPQQRRAYVYEDDDEDEQPRRARPSRRRAYVYEDDDEGEPQRVRGMRRQFEPPPGYAPVPASSGGGCARAVLYLVMGALVAFVIALFVFGQAAQSVGDFLNLSGMGGPTATPVIRADAAAVVQRIQSLQRLQTTSYTLDQTFSATSSRGDTFIPLPLGLGEEQLILIARGNISAGVDLGKLRPEDVTISSDSSTMSITLPPVEIFSVTLDNNATRVIDRDTGLLALDNPNLEAEARRYAEESIHEAACNSDIMQRATEDSRRAMEQFLGLLEFETVQINSSPPPPCEIPSNGAAPTVLPEPVPQP